MIAAWGSVLGSALVEAALRGAVIGSLALAFLAACRRIPAATRHGILLAAVLAHPAFLVLPHLLPAIHLPVLSSGPAAESIERGASAPISGALAAEAPGTTEVERTGRETQPLLGRLLSSMARIPSAAAPLVLTVWAAISLALLARVAIDHRAVARLRRSASRVESGRALELLEESRRRMAIGPGVELLTSPEIRIPTTWGLRTRTILLPPEGLTWSAARLRIVLLHELAHIRRRDCAVRFLCRLTRVFFWFSPVTALACERLHREAEIACDEAVVHEGIAPVAYAEHLLAILGSAGRAERRAAAPGAVARRGLESRIHSLLRLEGGGAPRGPLRRMAAAASIAASVLALAVVSPTAKPGLIGQTPRLGTAGLVRDAGLVTGCAYDGGALENRVVDGGSLGLLWLASWEGEGCRVTFRSDVAALTPGYGGIEDLPPAGGRLTVEVSGLPDGLSLEARRDGSGVVALAGTATAGGAGGERLPPDRVRSWLDAFAVELDRHTGNLARQRVPRLIEEGGIDRVLEEAELMRGDHAAACYLAEAFRSVTPTGDETARMLDLAARSVSNEAMMVQVLALAREGPGLESPGARRAWLAAAAHLKTRAGRSAALAGLGVPI